MTNFQALGKLIKEFGKHKPNMESRITTMAYDRPLNACVYVMEELQKHISKNPKLSVTLGPYYDALQEHPLTNDRPTIEQRYEIIKAICTNDHKTANS